MASERRPGFRAAALTPYRAAGGRTAGLMLAFASGPAHGAQVTAQQVLADSRAATSIGPDPCRRAAEDEIVVCGRVTNRYAVPLYRDDADAGRRDGRGSAAGGLATAREAFASCHARGEACLAPLPIVGTTFGKGKKSGVRVGKD